MVTDERANDAAREIADLFVLKITSHVRQAIAEIVQRAIDDAIDDRARDADPSGG